MSLFSFRRIFFLVFLLLCVVFSIACQSGLNCLRHAMIVRSCANKENMEQFEVWIRMNILKLQRNLFELIFYTYWTSSIYARCSIRCIQHYCMYLFCVDFKVRRMGWAGPKRNVRAQKNWTEKPNKLDLKWIDRGERIKIHPIWLYNFGKTNGKNEEENEIKT